MFETFGLKRTYRSSIDELDNNFIIPLLKHSLIYDRGTGFFTVEALSDLANGILPFLRHNGIIRILTSVKLGEEEQKIIAKGYELAETTLQESILNTINQYLESYEDDHLNLDLITNLIAAGRLQIKVAYIPDGGLYHEKIGFFKDKDGQMIYFSGSLNETNNAYKKNLESITVLQSWISPIDFESITSEHKYFETLWNDEDEIIKTLDFPKAAIQDLFSRFKKSNDLDTAAYNLEQYIKKNKSGLRPYQNKAIKFFVENNYCSFFEMATGTGKTFTAIKALEELNKESIPLFILILVPQIDLQGQWNDELEKQNIRSYLFGGEATMDFDSALDRLLIQLYQKEKLVVTISTYETYFAKLNEKLSKVNTNKLIIIDEAHTLSKNQISKLPETFKYRLGLSATPERFYKNEMDDILEYFLNGAQTFKYTIEDAIKDGYLSEYKYYPIFVNFTEEEFEEFKSYSKSIAQESAKEDPDEDKLNEYRMLRSRIVKKAVNKLDKLSSMLSSPKYSFHNSVIYCGQGKDEQDNRIIDSVTKLLHNKRDLKVHQFTSEKRERHKILKEFTNDFFDVLVAIKCLDQGVDIPKLDKIYIMSSDSGIRQTIQRRGRVLRLCKDSGKDMAYIYDMVVLPPDFTDLQGGKSLIEYEFRRVKEYLRLAVNKYENENYINEIEKLYGIKEKDYEREE